MLHAVIDGLLAGHEELTVAEGLQWLDEHGHWWEMLRTYLNETLTSKKASVVPDLLAGHSWVVPVPIGEGYKLPVMIAVATPLTPRKEWLARVSYQFQDEFKPMAQMKPESLREAARAIPGWLQDKQSRDIADELFEEEGYREQLKREHPEWSRAEVDRRYATKVGERAMRLRKRKAHFLEVVKKVMGGNAQA